MGLCEPQSTGIGGDCFVLVKSPGEKDIIALNGSGRSPRNLSSEKLRNAGLSSIPLHGVEAVTVPGAIDAFCQLSNDWGRKGLEFSLLPAIKYAEEGVSIGPRTAFDWAGAASILKGDARKHYLLDGKALSAGQLFKAPKQAEILRLVSKNGRSGFYDGEVAKDMVQSLNELGGVHTLSLIHI